MAQNQHPGDQQQQLRGLYAPQQPVYAGFDQQLPGHYIQGAMGMGQPQYMLPPQLQQYNPPLFYYPAQPGQLNGPQLQLLAQGAGQQAAAAAAASAAEPAASNKRSLEGDPVEGSDEEPAPKGGKLQKGDRPKLVRKARPNTVVPRLLKLTTELQLWRLHAETGEMGLCISYSLFTDMTTSEDPEESKKEVQNQLLKFQFKRGKVSKELKATYEEADKKIWGCGIEYWTNELVQDWPPM
jgi:hypothetical protein